MSMNVKDESHNDGIHVEAQPSVVVGRPTEQLEVEIQRDEPAEVVWPSGFRFYVNMTCILTAEFLLGLDLTIVAICVPSLTDQFKTVSDIGWYSAAYALMVCCFNFFFAKLYTLFAIKKLFIISLVIFEVGSLLCTVAPTSATFICGRAIAGVGNGGVTAGCILIIVHSFPNHKRPLINGLVGGVFTLATVCAPLVGGVLIVAWSWRLCFLINIPLGALVIASTMYHFENPAPSSDFALTLKAKAKRLDPLGAILLFSGITAFLLALQWGGVKFPWHSAVVISLFITSFVLLAVFVHVQHRLKDNAILPPKYLKNRTILATAWFAFCVSGSITIVELYFSIFFQSVRGYSASKAGVMGVSLIIGLAIGAPLGGVVISSVGYYSVPMYATSIVSPIAAGFLSTIDLGENDAKALALLGLLGFATGFASSSGSSAVQTILKPAEVPAGLAVTSIGGTMGAAISICVSTAMFHTRLIAEVRKQDPTLDVSYLSNTGLTNIRQNITSNELGKVLRGYDEAIDQTLYIPVALTTLTLIGSVAVGWRSVKVKST